MNNRKTSEAVKQEIVNKYQAGGTNARALALEYNLHPTTVWALLKCRGVKMLPMSITHKKYTDDETFFDQIDTEAKAYFLGMLYADGYNNVKEGQVSLDLQEQDKDVIEKFRSSLKSNRPIGLKRLQDKNPKHKNSARFNISSRKLSKSLERLGCGQCKSSVLKFPTEEQVPRKFLRHFVRGYFDGDGSFSFGMRKGRNTVHYQCGITSSAQFCQSLRSILVSILPIKCYLFSNKRHKESTKNLSILGMNCFRFMAWMYDDSQVYMNRKQDKYILRKSLLNAKQIAKVYQ